METVKNPEKFLKHCVSLREKGCRIVGLKSGSTSKGSEAAASHTGAIASPDLFVQALFDKAGVVRCHSRYALVTIAGLLQITRNPVSKFAVITHAGGPGVILTDHLVRNGLEVPTFGSLHQETLGQMLNPGAATGNPIDLLATGTADQLSHVIDYCDKHVDEVYGIVVIFGSPGLASIEGAYKVIRDKMFNCRKPVFPVLPSVVNAQQEIERFVEKGHIAFFDESLLGRGLGKIAETPPPSQASIDISPSKQKQIESLISNLPGGFLKDEDAFSLIDILGINTPSQKFIPLDQEIKEIPSEIKFPLVAKATGILHKTDQKALELNINSLEELRDAQHRLQGLSGAGGLMIQEMRKGIELYIGTQSIPNYPPLVVFGAGGIYLETFRDVSQALAPIDENEAENRIKSLKINAVLKGARGQAPIDIQKFSEQVSLVSQLACSITRIRELDLNPLIAGPDGITAVDVRIRLDP
jgi:acetyltransferase